MTDTALLTYMPVAGLLPRPIPGQAPTLIPLPPPDLDRPCSLMQALSMRRSVREYSRAPLTMEELAGLLWAANGTNRPGQSKRTAPSAFGLHEVDIYVALPEGIFRYDAPGHRLVLKRAVDARNLTGYQDFVGEAPLDLIYVVNYGRLGTVPASLRTLFAAANAGAIAQNVSLFCAAANLSTVVRGWLNHRLLAEAMSLNEDEEPVLAQTVGHRLLAGGQ